MSKVSFSSLSYTYRERERELISLGIFHDFGFVSESGIAIGVVCYDEQFEWLDLSTISKTHIKESFFDWKKMGFFCLLIRVIVGFCKI